MEIINNKARHNLIDEQCRWHCDRLDGAEMFREPLNQTKKMQIRQGGDIKPPAAQCEEIW